MGFLAGIGPCGDQNDGNGFRGGLRLELAAHGKAIYAGHQHIKQQQVRRVALAHDQRLLARGGHEHLVVPGQGLHQLLDVVRLVVHHQELGLAVCAVQQRRGGVGGGVHGAVGARGAGGRPFNHSPLVRALRANPARAISCACHVTEVQTSV